MSDITKNQIDDEFFELYTLVELSYQKHFKYVDGDLFPEQWYENKNYRVKIEIILEAIKTNTLIVDTEKYKNIIEGVDVKKRNMKV